MSTPFDYIPEVLNRAVEDAQPIDVKGRVIQVVGTIIKASVPGVKVGEICILRNPWEDHEVQAEVVGFTRDAVLLTALGTMIGISAETEVIPTRHVQMVPVGKNLLGRVVDGLGHSGHRRTPHLRRGAAYGNLRGGRRRQVNAARFDHPQYRGRGHRAGPHRRTWT